MAGFNHDDQAIIEAGYKPQLRRSLSFFASFAVAFSNLSILVGIFGNFGYALGKAGPFGLWTWPLVGFGQFLVALIFAEMGGRVPLTGAIYNWNIRLAGPAVGWLCAWMLFFAYCIGAVGVVIAIIPPFQTFVGYEFNGTAMRCVGLGVILLHTLINIYGVQLAAYMNKMAVVAELIVVVVFGLVLLTVILMHHEAHVALLTTIPENPTPYWPGFLLASLLAAWTIIGFELPSDLSEETINVKQVTPRSIISAVLLSVILGFSFLCVLIFAINDLAVVTTASDPVSVIMTSHLGAGMTRIFLVFVLIAIFALGMLVMAGASRILFAVARDQRLTGASFLIKISPRKVPITATLAVTTLEVIIFLTAKDAVDLFAAATILFFFTYLVTVVSFAFGLKKLPRSNSFWLGRWRGPVVVLAAIWLTSEICILTIPDEFHGAAIIAGSIFALGIPAYAVTRRKRRTA